MTRLGSGVHVLFASEVPAVDLMTEKGSVELSYPHCSATFSHLFLLIAQFFKASKKKV